MSATRRALITGAAAVMLGASAPAGLRISGDKAGLWRRENGPHLRGAVFVQRRVYPDLDGATFLGPGPLGPPITDSALDHLAQSGANLASWSGPGPFAETAPFDVDPAVEDHIADWLDRCRRRGLFTVLSFRSGPGRSAFAFHPGERWYPPALYDASIWREPEKQAAWAQMTRWTLRRFGEHPALAGVLAMAEPNGADLGDPEVWPALAQSIADAATDPGAATVAPLLLSPDRWARLEGARALRDAVGPDPVVITHDYTPWSFTHQAPGADRAFEAGGAGPAPGRELGPAGVLEFGAPADAAGVTDYLAHRIAAYEDAGVNWAAYRWTNGWAQYEAEEGRRNLTANSDVMRVLKAAFSRNTRHAGAL